jgi:hypothetical protein
MVGSSKADIPEDHLKFSGDRDIKWSWVAGNLPKNKEGCSMFFRQMH